MDNEMTITLDAETLAVFIAASVAAMQYADTRKAGTSLQEIDLRRADAAAVALRVIGKLMIEANPKLMEKTFTKIKTAAKVYSTTGWVPPL